MIEKQVGFLFKAASVLATIPKNNTHTQLLRSFYLMRCKEITRGYGLPQQQFSVKNRCSHCCLEWTKHTDTKVKPIKISQRQRRRIKQKNKTDLLHSNKLEQICTFCKHRNVMPVLKPQEETKHVIKREVNITKCNPTKKKIEIEEISPPVQKKNKQVNVYSKTRDVFSLSNKHNTLSNTIKHVPKAIKNNKKKKDKYAGLCKQAVLASAKLKIEKEKPNKLSLFLKPCP